MMCPGQCYSVAFDKISDKISADIVQFIIFRSYSDRLQFQYINLIIIFAEKVYRSLEFYCSFLLRNVISVEM